MGLDITAYANMVLIPRAQLADTTKDLPPGGIEEDAYEQHFTKVYVNPDFAERADDLLDRAWYGPADPSNLEMHSFSAGAYSNFMRFRKWLCRSIHDIDLQFFWDTASERVGQPFYEILNFSDCEGTIGPKTSAKIYGDFREYGPKLREAISTIQDPIDRETFAKRLDNWTKAFELASRGGFVSFH